MEKLRAEAHELSEGVAALTLSVDQLSDRARRSEKFITYLGVSLVLSVLLILALGFTGWKVYSIADCQAQQNEAFRSSITARQEATTLDRQGQRQLLDTILNPVSTQEQRREAVETYRSYLVRADSVRTGNPLPLAADCR